MLAAYLPKRDDKGWVYMNTQWIACIEGQIEDGKMSRKEGDALYKALEEESGVKPSMKVVPSEFF